MLHLYIQVRYEWDEKNRLNQKKHCVSFEVAALALEDENCLVRQDRIDETGEQRWHAVGAARLDSGTRAVLFVVHVYREVTDGEEVRIISACRADKHDVERYREQELD